MSAISNPTISPASETIALAGTGRRTTRLGYGCSSLMGAMGKRESLRLLEAAYEAGVRHFDVAPVYGYGAAEACVGEFRRTHEDVTVTTKYGIPPARNQSLMGVARRIAGPIVRKLPAMKRRMASAAAAVSSTQERPPLNANAARASLEQSLKALQTERIDLWLLHEAEVQDLADDSLLRLLEEARQAGKIGDFGVGSEARKVQGVLRERPEYCPVVQYEWSLMDAAIESRGPFRIHHRALTADFRKIHVEMCADVARCADWSQKAGADLANAETFAHLMLKAAFVFNPESVVLVSSKNPTHIQANMAVLCDAALEAPAKRLHGLVRTHATAEVTA